MGEPLVSIIIPIYRTEKYIEKCILSVINQSYENLEIILVDDGSPDRCPQICDEWAEKDDRIKVIHKKNGGLSDARNAGIEIASGDYIGFVDSDDFIDSEMYKTMLTAIKNNNAEIACCGRYIFQEGVKKKEAHCLKEEKVFSKKEAMASMLCGDSIEEAAWDKLYLASLFLDVRYPKGEINEDIVTTPLLIEKVRKVVHVGKALYYYRVSMDGISKSEYREDKRIAIDHIQWMKKYIITKFPDLMKYFYVFEGRYTMGKCRLIMKSKKSIEKYKDDLNIYKRMLKESYRYYIKYGKSIIFNDKIRALLIVHNLYRPAHALCKKI